MADFFILTIYIKRLCTSFTYYNNKRFYNCFNIVAMQFPRTVWWNVDSDVKHKNDVISYELKTRSRLNIRAVLIRIPELSDIDNCGCSAICHI